MTKQSIRALKTEAETAGDNLQTAICELALYGKVLYGTTEELSGSQRRDLASHYGVGSDGTTQDVGAQARAERECQRVIDFNRDTAVWADYGIDDQGAY